MNDNWFTVSSNTLSRSKMKYQLSSIRHSARVPLPYYRDTEVVNHNANKSITYTGLHFQFIAILRFSITSSSTLLSLLGIYQYVCMYVCMQVSKCVCTHLLFTLTALLVDFLT